MIIEVDFNSDEAIYIQLCNQIIMGIATSVIHEGAASCGYDRRQHAHGKQSI